MIFLDNAATSFRKPASVRSAVIRAMDRMASPGRGGYKLSAEAGRCLWDTREKIASLFGIRTPETVVFTDNATTAVNLALKGLVRRRDTFLISSMEHNAVARPASGLAENGAILLFAGGDEAGFVGVDAVTNAMTADTKLVCLIHASNVSGSINDIEAIGKAVRARGAYFMVDASQSAGCVPIDVEKAGIDLLAFPGHKGLLGPQGTGALYIRESVKLMPLTEGGTGSMSESLHQPSELPDRFESGTPNVPGIAGLSAALDYVTGRGAEDIGGHERHLARRLAEKLSVIPGVRVIGAPGGERSTGVVSVTVPTDCMAFAERLWKDYGVAVRAGLHCAPLAHRTLGTFDTGTVRFSPGAFTTPEEIDAAALAVGRCLTT